MKQFNLSDALAGKKVITRSGDPVTEIYYFKTSKSCQKLFGVVEGDTLAFDDMGIYNIIKEESQYDLFMAPEEVVRWVNVWRSNAHGFCGEQILYESESYAKSGRHSENYIGTFPITITL